MLIFAHMGVMESNKNKTFILHYPLMIGLFFVFSSTNIKKQAGCIKIQIHITKEKKFLGVSFFCEFEFVLHPGKIYQHNNALHTKTPQERYPIKNTDVIVRHFATTNALHVQRQSHTIHAQLPKIVANDSYVFYVLIHA